MASNMKIKKKSSEKTFDIINGAFLLILVILSAVLCINCVNL